jgi:uncharacterized protein
MTAAVRRLLIDLDSEFPRHWCGGDPFRTAFFNALSMSFPAGEQFFIDSVRIGHRSMTPDRQQQWSGAVQVFVGQEATHRRIHALFNAHLERQGYVNRWQPRIVARFARLEGTDPRHALAITAANEHFTAIFAEWALRHPELYDGVEPRLATMWQWHSAEECEHRSTAFDLYQALDGDHRWRVRWMRTVTVYFVADVLRQTAANLRHDGELFRWRTWRSAAGLFFGRGGLVRECFGQWRRYFARDFHPDHDASGQGERWLRDHSAAYDVVGRG